MRIWISTLSAALAAAWICSFAPAFAQDDAASAPSPTPTPLSSTAPAPTAVPRLLDTLVVTAQRRPTTVRGTSRETYVVTGDDLRYLQSPTVSGALAFLPGLFVKANGMFGGVESVLMRGASSEQTLVLIDGRPAGDADLGDFDFSSIAADSVSRVEVVEGGASTLYGSSAVGGVINILTAPPGSAPAAAAYESIGYEGATATGLRASGGNLRSVAATLAVRSSHARDQFDYPAFLTIPAGTRIDDDAKAQDVTLGLARQAGAVHATAHFNSNATDFGAPGDLEFCQAPPNNMFCPSGLARQQRVWTRSDAQLEWQSGSHAFSVQGYSDGRRLHFYDAAPPFAFDTLTTLATRGASVRDVWTANSSNIVVFGFDTRGDRATFGASFSAAPTVASDASSAWYVEDNVHRPSSAFSATLGLRSERPQGTTAVTVPSIGVSERLAQDTQLRANYARSFRTPTLDERYFPGFGTPTLQPEYGATFDVGIDRTIGAALARLTYFGTDTNNLIVDVVIDPFGDVAPENVARARVRGIEASYRAPLAHSYAIDVSYTGYPVAHDLTQGTRLFYRPSATGGLRLVRSFKADSLGVDLRYVGRRYADEKNQTLLPQLASVGAFAVHSLGDGTSLELRADNLTGERVQESYGYPVNGPTVSLTLSHSWRP